MYNLLLAPPVAFFIVMLALAGMFYLFSKLAFRGGKGTPGGKKPYACGEDIEDHLAQPDYSQFFPYAFFFTIAHVVTLIIMTVPTESVRTFALALIYVFTAVMGLYILLRR